MSVTIAYIDNGPERLRRMQLDWVSDSNGDVSEVIGGLNGTLSGVEFVPSTDSGTQPTDQYDLTLLSEAGIDVLKGKGGNLSNSTASRADEDPSSTPVFPVPVCGKHTLTIENAGAQKEGTVYLYYRP